MSVQNRIVRLATLAFLFAAGVTVTTEQAAKQTASEFYMAYRATFAKAKAIEDVLPYMSKGVRAKIEATPAAERPKMFEFVKQMAGSMTNVKVVKETKTDEGVMLTVEGTEGADTMTGQVQILREGDAWKMGRESWSNKS